MGEDIGKDLIIINCQWGKYTYTQLLGRFEGCLIEGLYAIYMKCGQLILLLNQINKVNASNPEIISPQSPPYYPPYWTRSKSPWAAYPNTNPHFSRPKSATSSWISSVHPSNPSSSCWSS